MPKLDNNVGKQNQVNMRRPQKQKFAFAVLSCVGIYIIFSHVAKKHKVDHHKLETHRERGEGDTPDLDTTCNVQCKSLQRLLNSHTWTRPRGVIYVLTHANRVGYLQRLTLSLEKYFHYPYPLLIFHEGHLTGHEQFVRNLTSRPVYFQTVTLETPTGVNPELNIPCFSPISYRNMCRFQAKMVYLQPALKNTDFHWRLDDDSELLENVTFDVFEHMSREKLLYGYIWSHVDSLDCTEGLWEAAQEFISSQRISTTFFQFWKQPQMFYNNFEVSSAAIWESELYQKYINFIDSRMGIYSHRWGDAPIKSIFVSILVPENRTRWFGDLAYKHGSFVNYPAQTLVARARRLFRT